MTTDELEALGKSMKLPQTEMAKSLGIGLTIYTETITRGVVAERYRLTPRSEEV